MYEDMSVKLGVGKKPDKKVQLAVAMHLWRKYFKQLRA